MNVHEDTLSVPERPGSEPSQIWAGETTVGRNGVAVAPRARTDGSGYRSYEIHQRERVHEFAENLNPMVLSSPKFARDPFPVYEILREYYPCYRDWVGNSYWVSRYDDVTSIFVDDANFETRSKAWHYGMEGFGRDLGSELPVLSSQAAGIDAHAEHVARSIVSEFANRQEIDFALDFAARYPLELLVRVLNIPPQDYESFSDRFWRIQHGYYGTAAEEEDGRAAIRELTEYFRPILAERRKSPGNDLVSAMATLEVAGGPVSAEDVTATLLESDGRTLHGAIANLWFLLLMHPDQLKDVAHDRRLMKFAYLETMRHSPPILTANRYTRHEVERFGRLLPEGALVICAAGAANRDPRVFSEPERFMVRRKDLCQREPRGQYRADGLAAGVAFGMGKPSKYPALPEDRPRSLYAIMRDTVVTASNVVLDMLPDLHLKAGATPNLCSLRLHDTYTCWNLPVELR